MTKLPQDLENELMSFLRETDDGDFEITDMGGVVTFIAAHGDKYPFLYGLVKVNEDALVERFERTGEVPPGVKMTRVTQESDNVTRLEVIHGPRPPKSK